MDRGLQFAPAVPGDEPAYTSLYRALANFDNGLPQVAHGNQNNQNNQNNQK